MKHLIKQGFNKENITSFGNMFLLGNGHLGYRGTLEEYSKDECVALNVSGFYDRYKKLWRETVNLPNPFFVKIKANSESCSVLDNKPINHQISLDIEHAIFERKTEFYNLIIKSERFVAFDEDNLLGFKMVLLAKEECDIEVLLKMDDDIWDINGPHFKKKKYSVSNKGVVFIGQTNEKKIVSEVASYRFKGFDTQKEATGYVLKTHLLKGEKREILALVKVYENERIYKHQIVNKKAYLSKKTSHSRVFYEKFNNARVEIKGDKASQDELDYSIYHLCILSNKNNKKSIAARGVSGQTYKGAIFWDTEVFLVPYYSLTDPLIARNCLLYRINTLSDAMDNAKSHGYQGAFYPWESQEGKEMCSKYNVTDVFTGKKIRTYFNEKQIHTSADMVIALERYMNCTNDYSLLDEGGLMMMKECIRFYLSYGQKNNGKIHINDVIGPDEYHERVNNNTFTNYSIKKACDILLKYLPKEDELYDDVSQFEKDIFIHKPNKRGIIEQFDGYFSLEDVNVQEVRSRLRHPHEYWGAKNGVATKTKVIKQADVIAMLALFRCDFSKDIITKNYKYYLPYTEHGSSLSSSMYALCALEARDYQNAYKMFRQSSSIDLGTNQKMYAGGIYIGGTHPASNAGAYLDVIHGFAGLQNKGAEISFAPKLPPRWKEIKFKVNLRGKKYLVIVDKERGIMEEIQND